MVNRLIVRGIVCGAVAVALAGCAPAGAGDPVSASPSLAPTSSPVSSPSSSPTPTPTPTVDPVALEVFCDADLVLHVSSDTVTATSAGVPLLVSSEAPPGTYLTYDFAGDELPASPETWMFTNGPGTLHLACWDPATDVKSAEVEVAIVDPHGYWSAATLEDYGCSSGAEVDWAIPPATGATPEEAIKGLIANFSDVGTRNSLTRWEHAEIGYPEARQHWILGSAESPAISAFITDIGTGFQATADGLCDPGAWLTPEG